MSHETPETETRTLFRRHGLRCTRQREVIYSALRESTAHPTAEELLDHVRSAEPGLSLATVYNTLEALTTSGLARRLPCTAGHGPCRYDADVSQHAHIATPDGSIHDVPADLSESIMSKIPPEVLREVEQRAGVEITGLRLQIEARPRDIR